VGDKYMAVSGLPEKCSWHARSVCNMALDMLFVVQDMTHKGEKLEVIYIQTYILKCLVDYKY
jgi:guanylate cyclase soluble subunit beta